MACISITAMKIFIDKKGQACPVLDAGSENDVRVYIPSLP